MRILTGIDVPFLPFGGSLVCCNDWYSNLPDDIEVRFLTLPPPTGTQRWWSIQDVVMLDIFKTRTPEAFPGYVAELQKAVEEQIKDFRPDIIHSQHLNYGLARAFANIATDIPRIGICHGTDVQSATKDPFFHDNMTQICDAMNLLLFPNEHMASDFFTVYGKAKDYAISALGIPDAYYGSAPRPLAFNSNRPLHILYAGRLLEWKGADIALQALAHMKYGAHLTIIGNEDQQGYKQEMLDFVANHNLHDKVNFRDQLPRHELLQEFANFDLIVFPSRRLEAFSLTVVEAQAKGLPVVYSAAGGGITETVGAGGIPIEDNTPEGLAKVLDNIYEHPGTLADMRAKGFENAEQYRLSASRDRLFGLSKELIDARAAASK